MPRKITLTLTEREAKALLWAANRNSNSNQETKDEFTGDIESYKAYGRAYAKLRHAAYAKPNQSPI